MFPAKIKASPETLNEKPHIGRPFTAISPVMVYFSIRVVKDLESGCPGPFAEVKIVIVKEKIFVQEADLICYGHPDK
jgi:hypothetical protein